MSDPWDCPPGTCEWSAWRPWKDETREFRECVGCEKREWREVQDGTKVRLTTSFGTNSPRWLTMDEAAVDHAIRVLNEALEADRYAIESLMAFEVLVNKNLAGHASIQCSPHGEAVNYSWLRPLGLINGLFGAGSDSWGYIAMEVDEAGRILRFIRTPERKEVAK